MNEEHEILRDARDDLVANGVEPDLAEQVFGAVGALSPLPETLGPALSAMCWLDARLGYPPRLRPVQRGAFVAFERVRQVFVRRVEACVGPGLLPATHPQWLRPVWR